jgi:hypothetical protein
VVEPFPAIVEVARAKEEIDRLIRQLQDLTGCPAGEWAEEVCIERQGDTLDPVVTEECALPNSRLSPAGRREKGQWETGEQIALPLPGPARTIPLLARRELRAAPTGASVPLTVKGVVAAARQRLLIVQDPEDWPARMAGEAVNRWDVKKPVDPMEDEDCLTSRFRQQGRQVDPGGLIEVEGVGGSGGRSAQPPLGPIPPRRDDARGNLPDGRIVRPLLTNVESGIAAGVEQGPVEPEGGRRRPSLPLLARKMADPNSAAHPLIPRREVGKPSD